MSDTMLIWAITVLLLLAAIMRLNLAKKQGKKLSAAEKVQACIFPVAMLNAAILYQLGADEFLMPVLILGILEEVIFWAIRKHRDSADPEK